VESLRKVFQSAHPFFCGVCDMAEDNLEMK